MAEDTTPETADEVEEFTISRESVSPETAELVAAATGGGGAAEQTVRFEEEAVPADVLRARLQQTILNARCEHLGRDGWACSSCRADAAVAELVALCDPGDLTARMDEAMRFHDVDEDRDRAVEDYCACGEQVDDWEEHAAKVALSVRWELPAHLAARLAEAERRAEHAEEARKSIEDHHTTWQREKARADKAEADLQSVQERNERWWNETHERAEAAEAQVAALQRELAEAREQLPPPGSPSMDSLLELGQQHADQQRQRAEHAEGELSEAKRMIDDTLWRMHQLRSWAYRETSGDVQHDVLSVITNVWDCLDPDRTRNPSLWCEGVPPDDPEEIRRLAQATTEETNDEH